MDLDLYIAVAVGAFVGMLWPVIVALVKNFTPQFPVVKAAGEQPTDFEVAVTHSGLAQQRPSLVGQAVVWVLLCVLVAAIVAALNIVPLVTGDAADKLKLLGGWEYFFLGAEGFALASFFEEGIRTK